MSVNISSFVFGEQPSLTKWQYLWSNDSAFQDGSGLPTAHSDYAAVNTSETTSSTSYVSLATATDSVTVTIGATGMAMVLYGCDIANSVSGAFSYCGVAMSGANSETAGTNNNRRLLWNAPNNSFGHQEGNYLAKGLTPGSTTFSLKYTVSANIGTFAFRHISVIPI